MADRYCGNCGAKSSPHVPRQRVNDVLMCGMCASNEGRRYTAAAGEEAIRHELGRQRVHTVNGRELCPTHVSLRDSQNEFANRVLDGAGIDGQRYEKTPLSEPHEGRCEECSKAYGPDGRDMPWAPPGRLAPVHEERQPTRQIEDEDGGVIRRGRWPYRPLPPTRTERHVPVDTTIQSLNARTAMYDDEHPDIAWKRRTFGAVNTSLGRAGFARHRTAGITDFGFHDPEGWKQAPSGVLHPVRHAIEGARAYANAKGFGDPHAHDFSNVLQHKERVGQIGKHYDQMPEFDHAAVPHFHAMGNEVAQQHEFATKRMGIKFQTVDHDPYKDVHEMVHDVQHNKTLKVMGTHVTGGHPFFSNEDNDKFRGVHDLFGHAATGRGFDRHGEEAAFQAHSLMFSHHARPAMAAETRGQNSSLIMNGDFGPQKVGILPEHMHSDHSIDFQRRSRRLMASGWSPRDAQAHEQRSASVRVLADGRVAIASRIGNGRISRVAHDSGDGETLFHCPFCGSGQIIARNDGTTECEFCSTAFTVQVQPQMPAFPQTIDGVPVDVPGMPAGGQNANVPPGAAPGADPMDPNAADPAVDGSGDSPFGADDGDDGESSDDSDDKPDFLKKSFRTSTGARVTGLQYMRHLAIAHSRNRGAVLEQIRDENGARR